MLDGDLASEHGDLASEHGDLASEQKRDLDDNGRGVIVQFCTNNR